MTSTSEQARDAWETLDVVEIMDALPGQHWNQVNWFQVFRPDQVVMYHDLEEGDKVEDYCGFTGCYAGWRAYMDGGRPLGGCRSKFELLDGGVLVDGYAVSWESWLADRLGLTLFQISELTSPDNDLHDLRFYIERHFGPRPKDLPNPNADYWLNSAKTVVPVEGGK